MRRDRESRLTRAHLAEALQSAMPAEPSPEACGTWRDALATEPAWHRSRLAAAGARAMRPLGLTAAALAFAMAVLLCASLLSPTVALYAGSLPGVGPVLYSLHRDRGLWLAHELNLAVQVDREVTDGEIQFRVHSLVADNIRTVMDYEVRMPASLWAELSDSARLDERLSRAIFSVALWDQWGNRYAWRSVFPSDANRLQVVGDSVVYRWPQEFRVLELQTRRMTAGLFVLRPELGIETAEEFLEAAERLAVRITFPADFRAAASKSRVFYPNVSDEVDGVRATLVEVTQGATAIKYRFAIEGLGPMLLGPIGPSISVARGSDTLHQRAATIISLRDDGECTITSFTPASGTGTSTIYLDAEKVHALDLTLPLKRTPDGRPVPVGFSFGDLRITLTSWQRIEDRLELEFSGEAPPDVSLAYGMLVAVPGGDKTDVMLSTGLRGTATFYSPSRLPGVWLDVPPDAPDPPEITIVAMQESISRPLRLTFEWPK